MKINKSFIRIALAAGLVGLAACGGSDSSSNRDRNSAIETNVKRYQGTIQVSGTEYGSRTSPDQYAVSFDMNLDAVSTQPFATGPTSSHGDFRNAFSNFSIEKDPDNKGTLDLSAVKWAQCPYDSYLYKNDQTPMSEFQIVFVEAPDPDIASAACGQPAPRDDKYHQAGLWDDTGEYVRPEANARYLTFGFRDSLGDTSEDFPSLISILPNGLDPYFDASKNVYAGVAVSPPSLSNDSNFALSLSSTKLKDYQPYELTGTPQASTIDLNWKRSVDLVETDEVSYELLWTIENYNWVESVPLDDVTEYKIPGCLVNPKNNLAVGTKVSLQLVAIDKDGIRSAALEKSVSIADETVQCPTTKPLAAPTGFTAAVSKETISASWNAIEALDPESTISYCVSEVNPNLTDSTSDELVNTQDSVIVECTTDTKLTIKSFRYQNPTIVKYFVQAQSTSGVLSERSEVQAVSVPKEENVSGVTISPSEGGLNVKWNRNSAKTLDQVFLFYSVNVDMNCDQIYADLKELVKTENGYLDAMNRLGAVINSETFFLSNDRLGNEYVPGSIVTVCAKRMGLSMWGESPDWGTATYTNPLTATPAVEATARTAIVTETATEVQLPAAAIEVTVKVEDVYTGFGVSASDVKSIEYQIDAGSWTAVTPGAALEIPKAASKMAIRVTKTNGEEVVSEKAIVRTEESTDTTVADSDTTMAPADTTAPVTTDAPESSESSSSNNILLYILGLVILAAIAGFFFKKKSASTK
jgi:LPXTG-motif cell wall-anchored protein